MRILGVSEVLPSGDLLSCPKLDTVNPGKWERALYLDNCAENVSSSRGFWPDQLNMSNEAL
jgi:hypothetical protein